ncbi:MAG: LamG-like jellyroll fold domain-containing protein, partial [Pseudomonadota bacterium]
SDLVLLDRALTPGEVLFLAQNALELGEPGSGSNDVAASAVSDPVVTLAEDVSAPKVTSQSPGQPAPTANGAHEFIDVPGNAASREYFEPLGTTPGSGQTLGGSASAETLSGAAAMGGSGLPGALSFYSFANEASGSFADLRGGPSVTAYVDAGNTATVSATLRAGPDGSAGSALEFNGDDTFAYLEHSPAWEVSQGTIALWVQPDDLSSDGIILSKDLRGSGDGGHFRLGHEEDGTLFLRVANGDGSGNRAWESSIPYLEEGEWSHLAVSFSADGGVVVYVDGVAVPDSGWIREEGNEDLPSLQSEAYLIANREPWILGADTSRSEDTDSPDAFAAEHNNLRDAFDGAIADFAIFGGDSAEDVLSASQVFDLATNGPGSALTGAAGPQPMVAADDVINGGGGNDTIYGEAGDDELSGGAGHDELRGGYGNDLLQGDAGDDVLEGGRGADLLLGGAGDDVLISHSDAGEQRIGQLAIGDPTRPDPDNEVNPERQKLYGWEDQPLIADDILVGGEGADTFLFNPQINGKRDIILEHVNDDRTIDWAGVAGENNELHDHWIDSFGIDVIADYVAGEDTISIVGHTVAPQVEQRLIDTDGDGVLDESVSIITVYSNQHGNGGAHDQDLIGQIIVHGDPVDLDDIITDAGVTHGVVETIDEIGEALAPTGEVKTSLVDGEIVYGYDTRSGPNDLGAITGNPQDFIDNPWLNSSLFNYASTIPEDLPPPVAVLSASNSALTETMSFNKANQDYVEVAHTGSQALVSGTLAFSFTVNSIGELQTLVSKDASGWEDGGHLTVEVSNRGQVEVRFQGDNGDGFENIYLKSDAIEAGQTYDLAFSFTPEGTSLYLNGELVDRDEGFAAGISANDESLVVGASTTTRTSGELNKLKEFLDGEVSDLVLLDRALTPGEVLFLAQNALEIETSSEATLAASPTSAQIVKETIYGTELSETLTGSEGDDWFYGDDGNDLMTGLGGRDIFVFAPEQGNDTITDFDPVEDYLALRDSLQVGGLRAVDADSDGQIDDTIIRFDPGDSVTLLDVLVTEDDLTFI